MTDHRKATIIAMGISSAWAISIGLVGFFSQELERKSMQNEAFKRGLMIKSIGPNDKVVYNWIETHKIEGPLSTDVEPEPPLPR